MPTATAPFDFGLDAADNRRLDDLLAGITAACSDPDQLLPTVRRSLAGLPIAGLGDADTRSAVWTALIVHIAHRWPYVDANALYRHTGGL